MSNVDLETIHDDLSGIYEQLLRLVDLSEKNADQLDNRLSSIERIVGNIESMNM